MKIKQNSITKPTAILMAMSGILLLIGFATDGLTEIGHHFCLIMAGILLGLGIGHYETK